MKNTAMSTKLSIMSPKVFICILIIVKEIFGEKCSGYNKIISNKAGDYYLTGLFPAWSTAPTRLNTNALVYMEMMKYVIHQANEISSYN